jgi:LmbE family N-acetylglucosaminyl deacetylase
MAGISWLSRRAFGRLATAVLGLGSLATLAAADSNPPDRSADGPEIPIQARLTKRAAFLQIVAHPDDDLYFLNPDVADAVRTGTEVVTIVLTAAEADGVNGAGGRPDPAGYAAARQHGLRSAYAAMAGEESDAPWLRERIPTRGGVAELHTLTAAPRIRLVFLNIAMGTYSGTGDDSNHTELAALWAGKRKSQPTRPPTGALMADGASATSATSYTREQLIGTLADLLQKFQPTLVRTLDPDPERRGPEPQAHAWFSDGGLHTDNEDHTATARFAYAALARHHETPQGELTLVDSYIGYGNARWKHNLGRGATAEKLALLSLYGWADHRPCGEPAGCGDLNVGSRAPTTGWLQSTNLRHPGTTDWLRLGRDGRLVGYAVVGGRVRRWTETEPGGGRFGGGTDIGGSGLARHLTVAEDAAGRVHLAALRIVPDPGLSGPFHEVMVAADDGRGRFAAWTNLGAPHGPVTGLPTGIGNPVLAVDGSGVHHLFVRNGDKSVSWATRDPSDGPGWSDWTDIGGVHVRDGLAAVVNRSGEVELYADGHVLWRWRITGDGVPRATEVGLPGSADALTLAPLPGERCAMVTRGADTGEVVGRIRESPAREWRGPERQLGGSDGFGVIAAHPHRDGLFLAQRGRRGLTEVIWQPDADTAGTARRWLSGPAMAHGPALASDVAGNTVVAVVGPDAELYTARVDPDDEAPSLSWA